MLPHIACWVRDFVVISTSHKTLQVRDRSQTYVLLGNAALSFGVDQELAENTMTSLARARYL